MYDASKFICIDILKACGMWQDLVPFNTVLNHIWDTGMNGNLVTYDIPNGGAPDWFNPRKCREIGYSAVYPKTHPIQQDPRLNLAMDCYGHSTLAVINTLYWDKKDILIEEIGVGFGNLPFYLAKLGFHNFHFIDNWSQISKKLLDQVMMAGNIKYDLNNKYAPAVVSNIVQCETYFKFDEKGNAIVPNTLELFCSYGHLKPGAPMGGINPDRFFKDNNFTCLALDPYNMMYMFCRADKYEEFRSKLQHLVV